MKRLITLCCISLLAIPHVMAAREADLKSFRKVWEIVRDRHWDLSSTGLDWDATYDKYLPKAEATNSRDEMRKVITEMLAELGQSHFGILGAEAYDNLEELNRELPSGTAYLGFEVSHIDGRVFITHIDKESEAYKQGMRIGTEISVIRDKPVSEILTTLSDAYEDSPHRRLYEKRSLNNYFKGDEGETYSVTTKANKVYELQLIKPPGRFFQLMTLPSVYYQFTHRKTPENFGYISFNMFTFDLRKDYLAALAELSDTDGLILDLRGNGGGIGAMAMTLSAKLINEKGKKLGTMSNQGGHMNFAIFPQKPIYDKPIALIIDGGSASTTEILAAGLQDLERAHIFGTPSAGAALPSLIEALPNGDRFQFAIADYTSTNGSKIEGKGVQPDTLTPHTIESLSKGQDAAMVAATMWLKQKNHNKTGGSSL
jgi:carboxyl-terminal processing protease